MAKNVLKSAFFLHFQPLIPDSGFRIRIHKIIESGTLEINNPLLEKDNVEEQQEA
jgi:hypothetical protein